MTIRSPKTAHHEGKDSRQVPIFDELLPHLEDVCNEAEPKVLFVITRYRDPKQNLRTQFERIIHRADLTAWPKLFQNLRSSRVMELATDNPAHVAAAWMGHSTLIANKQYWQVTDADFERAVGGKPGDRGLSDRSVKAAQIPAQSTQETGGNSRKSEMVPSTNPSEFPAYSSLRRSLGKCPVGDEGFEPPTPSV